MQHHQASAGLATVRWSYEAPRNVEIDAWKHDRIVACAREAFLTLGYEKATLENIASDACVGKATIYKYFLNKSDLFWHCMQELTTAFTSKLKPILGLDRSLNEVLALYAFNFNIIMMSKITRIHYYYDYSRLLIGTSLSNPEISRRCADMFHDHLGNPLLTLLKKNIESGHIQGDPMSLSEMFNAMIFFTDHIVLNPSRAPAAASLEARAELIVCLFLNGCKASRKSPGHGQPFLG